MHKRRNSNLNKKKLFRNISFSIGAQAISLIVSFLISIISPKFVSELTYAYWQQFILYLSFVGIVHFGLLDGLILRYASFEYEDLDKKKLFGQFVSLITIVTLFAICGIIASIFISNQSLSQIIFYLSIGVILKNVFTFFSYLFQISNRIKNYALMVILQRAVYALIVLALLLYGVDNFAYYCIAELIGDTLGIIFGVIFNREIFKNGICTLKNNIIETANNIRSGILLMLSNWSSIFIVGAAKIFIQLQWGDLVFGKISLAFSASSFCLSFITAVSVALFPSLKRTSESSYSKLYINIRNGLSPFLLSLLIFYFPGAWILSIWLPEYFESVKYLALIFPVIIYTAKVDLLTNNFFKAYREEKKLFFINLLTMFACTGIYAIEAFAISNIDCILISIVVISFTKYCVSEILLSKHIGCNFLLDDAIELVVSALFIASSLTFTLIDGFFIYLCVLILYITFFFKVKSRYNFENIFRITK